MLSLADQITAFAWTVFIGIAVGTCYQFYQAIKERIKLNKLGVFAGDVFFGILLTIFSFTLLLQANYGQIRFYFFVGLILGVFIYVRLLAGFMYKYINMCFYLLGKAIRYLLLFFYYIWKVISFPFKVILAVVFYPLQLLGGAVESLKKSCGNAAKFKIGLWRGKIRNWLKPPD